MLQRYLCKLSRTFFGDKLNTNSGAYTAICLGGGGHKSNYAELSDFTEDFEKRELFLGSTVFILTDCYALKMWARFGYKKKISDPTRTAKSIFTNNLHHYF